MRFAIYSTMRGMPWGGSEELWSRAATELCDRGHEVHASYFKRRDLPRQIHQLMARGVEFEFPRKSFFGKTARSILKRLRIKPQPGAAWVRRIKPDFLLVSAGYHTDSLAITQACREANIPYGILLQSASPYQWIEPWDVAAMREAYQHAARLFFVSGQNRRVIESNLALDLEHAEIVDNPFNLPDDPRPTWPGDVEPWKLACVGRMHFQSKAQDVVLDVLRQQKWRDRPLEVSFYGSDNGSLGVFKQIVEQHGLEPQVKLGGYSKNIVDLWSQHHALLLPSRFEGNPLAMIEAMRCGRLPIITNVGRVAELVEEGRTGFIAPAATSELVDAALERAWDRRHDWQSIGAAAAQSIRNSHSERPEVAFAERLLNTKASSTSSRLAA